MIEAHHEQRTREGNNNAQDALPPPAASSQPAVHLLKAVIALARSFELPEATSSRKTPAPHRFRGLRIDNLGLLVAHDCGGEIIEDAHICPLPGAPAWCRGLINLRGHLLPAFDLHESLGLARQRASKQWWLALGAADDALAFPVDALPRSLLTNEASAVQPAMIPEPLRAHTGAAYRIGGDLWLTFHHREFFHALSSAGGRPLS